MVRALGILEEVRGPGHAELGELPADIAGLHRAGWRLRSNTSKA